METLTSISVHDVVGIKLEPIHPGLNTYVRCLTIYQKHQNERHRIEITLFGDSKKQVEFMEAK